MTYLVNYFYVISSLVSKNKYIFINPVYVAGIHNALV